MERPHYCVSTFQGSGKELKQLVCDWTIYLMLQKHGVNN